METKDTFSVLLSCVRPSIKENFPLPALHAFQDLDWSVFLQAAKFHGVLAHIAKRFANDQHLSAPIRNKLKFVQESTARKNLFAAAECLRITEALKRGHIPMLPIKGLFLAKLLYNDISTRSSVDIDVLIRKQDFAATKRVLSEIGYAPTVSRSQREEKLHFLAQHDFDLYHPKLRMHIDLHTELVWKGSRYRFETDYLIASAGEMPFHGKVIPSLTLEDLLVYLCVHGTLHFWDRLILICDVAKLMEQSIDLAKAREIAKDRNALGPLELGLALADELFGEGEQRYFSSATSCVQKHLQRLSLTKIFFLQKMPFLLSMRKNTADAVFFFFSYYVVQYAWWFVAYLHRKWSRLFT